MKTDFGEVSKEILKYWKQKDAGVSDWQKLVKHFANGRSICNCGEAYRSPCGEGVDDKGNTRTDMLVCKHGCSAAQIQTRVDISAILLSKLNIG